MNLKVDIKNGSYELASSGTVIVNASKTTIFTITDNGTPMSIHMKFENDNSDINKLSRSVKPIINENAIEVTFRNYTSVFGTYNKEPWLIGDVFNRKLYLFYVITEFNDSDNKRIEYSFFLGEEVRNG